MIQTNSDSDGGFIFMVRTSEYQLKSENENEIVFIVDSGATEHIINNDKFFTTLQDLREPFSIAVAKKKTWVFATKRGNIMLISNLGVNRTLEDVLYCPEVPYNLLSVKQLQEKGFTTHHTFSSMNLHLHWRNIFSFLLVPRVICVTLRLSCFDLHLSCVGSGL
jgi:hypothetical protein